MDRLATIQEAAAVLQMSERSVRTHIARGTIPAMRVGPRAIRLDMDAVMRALSGRSVRRVDGECPVEKVIG